MTLIVCGINTDCQIRMKMIKRDNRKSIGDLLTIMLLLLASVLHCQNAKAQTPSKYRVVIAGCLNLDTRDYNEQAAVVTDSLYRELTGMSNDGFEVITKKEILDTARRLSINLRGGFKYLTQVDILRIAIEQKANIIVQSDCVVAPPKPKKPSMAGVMVELLDTNLGEYVASERAYTTAGSVSEALEKVTLAVVQKVTKDLYLTARVVNFMLIDEKDNETIDMGILDRDKTNRATLIVVLNRGKKHGIKSGDEFTFFDRENRKRKTHSQVRVIRVFENDCEAEVLAFGGNFRLGTSVLRVARFRQRIQY
jgi:hypothetical protein